MASAFTHAISAVAIGNCLLRSPVPLRIWVTGIVCSIIPDLDVIGFKFGIAYGDLLGHRGLTHSLLFAALFAGLMHITLVHKETLDLPPLRIWFFLFIATASHGLLDAMTNGGLGIAFFSPFDETRYFLPFQPILVSPIGISAFFSTWGLAVLKSELLWVWLPCLIVVWAARKSRECP